MTNEADQLLYLSSAPSKVVGLTRCVDGLCPREVAPRLFSTSPPPVSAGSVAPEHVQLRRHRLAVMVARTSTAKV